MRYFLAIALLLPITVMGQLRYKNNFDNGINIQTFSRGPIISANYNRNFNFNRNSFFTASAGLSYVFGYRRDPEEPNPFGYYNSGIGIPISVSYNYFIGNLDENLFNMLYNNCINKPPKFNIEMFLEGGVEAMPAIYKLNYRNEIRPTAFGGAKLQMMFRRPYHTNDLIVFLRGGGAYSYMSQTFRPLFYGSLGFNI